MSPLYIIYFSLFHFLAFFFLSPLLLVKKVIDVRTHNTHEECHNHICVYDIYKKCWIRKLWTRTNQNHVCRLYLAIACKPN